MFSCMRIFALQRYCFAFNNPFKSQLCDLQNLRGQDPMSSYEECWTSDPYSIVTSSVLHYVVIVHRVVT